MSWFIREAGLDGFWVHRSLRRMTWRAVSSIARRSAVSRRRRRAEDGARSTAERCSGHCWPGSAGSSRCLRNGCATYARTEAPAASLPLNAQNLCRSGGRARQWRRRAARWPGISPVMIRCTEKIRRSRLDRADRQATGDRLFLVEVEGSALLRELRPHRTAAPADRRCRG